MPLASPFEPGARKNCADGHAAYRRAVRKPLCRAHLALLLDFPQGRGWLRGLDSNQDSQLQRLVSYQLDDPGTDTSSVAEPRKCPQGPAVGSSNAGIMVIAS